MTVTTKHKLLIAIAVLCGGLLLGAAYALSTIDTQKIVRLVSAQVKEATGRDLTVKGPVSVKLFPQLAVVAEQVALSNPSWASDRQMMTAKQIAFAIQWKSLLSKQIEIDHVALDQVQLVLQAAPPINKRAGNWVFDSPDTSATASNNANGYAFELTAMQLNQVSVVYKNTTGAAVDTLLIKRFDIKSVGHQVQLDGVMTWNGLPLTLKGQTDSWQTLSNNWAVKPTDFSLDLNVGLNKQSARVKGQIRFAPKSNPVVDLVLQSDLLDLTSLMNPQKTSAKTASDSMASGGKVFSTASLGFNALPVWQGKVTATIGALTLPDGLKLKKLNATISASANDGLIFSPVSFDLGTGQVVADAQLSGVHSSQSTLKARAYATSLSFEQIMAQLGKGQLVSGGPTQVAFNINSRGSSVSALAANANGAFQISVGPATVNNSIINLGGDFLLTLANAVNPLRKNTENSQLSCLVGYLPVSNGLVKINHSVGMRTHNLDLTLDGQVNLGTESLNINFQPKERSGLTTGVNPAGLVQVVGTLANPRMGINKTGVVKQAAGVGLAIVTGGVSLMAQNAAGVVTRSSPCDNVLRPWSQAAGGLELSH